MSLDVYLKVTKPVLRQGTGVFVRDGGNNKELTPEEVAERWPGAQVAERQYETEYVYESNITHNLNNMAEAAGIYQACWRPEEIGVAKAGQLVPLLEAGLSKLKANPEHYKTFNSANGWGMYEHFVPWVERYLEACKDNPEAEVSVSR